MEPLLLWLDHEGCPLQILWGWGLHFSISVFQDRSLQFRVFIKCVLNQDGRFFTSSWFMRGQGSQVLLHLPPPPHGTHSFQNAELCPGQRKDCRAGGTQKCSAKCCSQVQNGKWWWGLGKEIWILILLQSSWIKNWLCIYSSLFNDGGKWCTLSNLH